MSNTYGPRRVLLVLAALLLPAATCGVAPTLVELVKRTERLEYFVEHAQLPPVLMDDHGIVIGRVLEYNDLMLYSSIAVEQPFYQGKASAWDFQQEYASATVLFEVPGQRPVALELAWQQLHAPIRGNTAEYFFETTDCSGAAWVRPPSPRYLSPFGHARVAPPGRTLYTADLDAAVQVRVRAKLVEFNSTGTLVGQTEQCIPLDYDAYGRFVPMNRVYNLDAFMPPFQIVDQRDLWLR